MRKVLRKYTLASALVLMLALMTPGQNPNTVTELDPGLAVGFDINRHVRLDVYTGREKSDELDSGKWKIGAGVSLRAKPVFKSLIDNFDSDKQHVLVTGVTYEYSRASEANVESIEHKLMLDATARYAFAGKLLLSNRNRFEFRWIDAEYRFRYRNRFFLERTWKAKAFKFTPYGGAEAFWDQNFNKWNQFRFTGGVQIPIPKFKRTSIDLYYERVRCTTCANPNTNVFAANLNIFFRRKK